MICSLCEAPMTQTSADEWSCPAGHVATRVKGEETRARIAEVRAKLDEAKPPMPLTVPQVALGRVVDQLREARRMLDEALLTERPRRPRDGEEPSDEYVSTLGQLSQVAFTVHEAIAVTREMWAEAAAALARYAPSGVSTVDLPGVRPFQPHFPKDRTQWDNAALVDEVRRFVFARTLDPDTGELVAPDPEQMYERMVSIVSINGSNAKVGGLRAAGIDPDTLCTSQPKDPDVRFL